MTKDPFIAYSELTNEIYIVVGKEKYRVTEQAIKAVMAIKSLEQDDVLDKIRTEIIKYEGNCRLAVDEYPSCKQCTDNVFKSIYGFFDKYRGESEDKE
jgi:hypothetical protein